MEQLVLTSGIEINITSIRANLQRIINQTYKLLPMRQEKKEWRKPLETLIEQLSGMKRLIDGQDDLFFLILCKMEGLFSLGRKEDMGIYRRIIFELLSLLNSLRNNVCAE